MLAVDGAGNVYVAGDGNIVIEGIDDRIVEYCSTIKYDPEGNELWVTQRLSGGFSASALAVDAAGNVYVTIGDATVKYDPEGNELWEVRHGRGGGPEALAVDDAGNVYVAGTQRSNYATVKYDSEGNELWVARYDGPGGLGDVARALEVDAAGNVYVTGNSYGSDSRDYATIKYDREGNELWVVRYDSRGGGEDWAFTLAVDQHGNVHVAGESCRTGFDCDYATVKYDSEGNELWVARYDEENGFDRARTMAVDHAGSVYVNGTAGRGFRCATVKYDSEGNELWVARGRSGSFASSLAIDVTGNVYLTGTWALDFATVKYSQQRKAFQRGDCNDDGEVDISDGICILNWLFLGADAPNCVAATNTNGDEGADISDPVYLFAFLFLGGPAPTAPFPDCGVACLPSDATQGCEAPPERCQ